MNVGTGGTKLLGDPVLYDLRFTIYSIIMQYKHRVPPTCTNWGDKIFFRSRIHCFVSHYGIRCAAPVLRWLFIELANKVRIRV